MPKTQGQHPITKLRLLLGLLQKEMARELLVSEGSIAAYDQEAHAPRWDVWDRMLRLAKRHGYELRWVKVEQTTSQESTQEAA